MSGGVPEAAEALLLAMDARALRGHKHVPAMRDEQDARGRLRKALDAATPTPPIEGRDADVERDVLTILQAVAEADSEDCIGSIDVDIPKDGYPRQWLRDAARAALQALGERG